MGTQIHQGGDEISNVSYFIIFITLLVEFVDFVHCRVALVDRLK